MIDITGEWRAFCSKVRGMDDPETMALAKWAFACGANAAMNELKRPADDIARFTDVALAEIRALSAPATPVPASGSHAVDYDPMRSY